MASLGHNQSDSNNKSVSLFSVSLWLQVHEVLITVSFFQYIFHCYICFSAGCGEAVLSHAGGGSGGYLEHIIKYAAKDLFGLNLETITYKTLRYEATCIGLIEINLVLYVAHLRFYWNNTIKFCICYCCSSRLLQRYQIFTPQRKFNVVSCGSIWEYWCFEIWWLIYVLVISVIIGWINGLFPVWHHTIDRNAH